MTALPAFARAVCEGLRDAGIRHVVYVPDNPLAHVIRGLEGVVTTVLATREEEAVGVAAGLYLGGAQPVVMMQSSGLGNAVNALASLLIPYQIPLLLLVSMRGDPGEWNSAQVPMGRATEPVLEALGIPRARADRLETMAETVRLAGRLAFDTRTPVACLLPRRLTAPSP